MRKNKSVVLAIVLVVCLAGISTGFGFDIPEPPEKYGLIPSSSGIGRSDPQGKEGSDPSQFKKKLDKYPLNLNLQKIIAPDISYKDRFGYSVSVSPSGKYLAVGAPTQDLTTWHSSGKEVEYFSAGAVYLFRKEPTGCWTLQEKLVPSPSWFGGEEDHCFGVSVAVTDTRLVVGAVDLYDIEELRYSWISKGKDEVDKVIGAVYVYTINGSSPLSSPDKFDPYFTEPGDWSTYTDTEWLNSYFGICVDVSEDGNVIAVGAPWEYSLWTNETKLIETGLMLKLPDWTSAVYVYSYPPGGANGPVVSEKIWGDYSWSSFGYSLSLSPDGKTLGVGKPDVSRCWFYRRGDWLIPPYYMGYGWLEGTTGGFGTALDISDDLHMACSAPEPNSFVTKDPTGLVTLSQGSFEKWSGWTTWTGLNTFSPVSVGSRKVANPLFGHPVAYSPRSRNKLCDLIVAGCTDFGSWSGPWKSGGSYPGAVFIYTVTDTVLNPEVPQVLTLPNAGMEDEFGWSLSISQDGMVLAIGDPTAFGTENCSGAVYIAAPLLLETDTSPPAPPGGKELVTDYYHFENLRALVNPLLFNPWDPDPLPYNIFDRLAAYHSEFEEMLGAIAGEENAGNYGYAAVLTRELKIRTAEELMGVFEEGLAFSQDEELESRLESGIEFLRLELENLRGEEAAGPEPEYER